MTEFVVTYKNKWCKSSIGDVVILAFDDKSYTPHFSNLTNRHKGCIINVYGIELKERPMTKTVKVENNKFDIPEGYKLASVTLERDVNNRPRSWDDYIAGNNISEDDKSFLGATHTPDEYRALRILQLMRDVWVGDWVVNWCDFDQFKNSIIFKFEKPVIQLNGRSLQRPLSFPNEEIAKDFLEAHKELIEAAKPLL